MIITVRTGQVANGKAPETREWATRLARYLRDKYPERNFRLVEEVLGDHRILAWISEYDSLAALEAFQEKIVSDAKYNDLMAEQRNKLLYSGEKNVTKGYRVLVG
jgi:hypothetical protein